METKTATPEFVTKSARALATLPRRPKRIWSGWLNSRVRGFRNMPVAIQGGQKVFVFGVLRGRMVYTVEPNGPAGDPDEAGRSWGVVPVSSVQVVKNSHAVYLGRRKGGVSERRSELKTATARANGLMPVRPGKGRRGRPKLTNQSQQL